MELYVRRPWGNLQALTLQPTVTISEVKRAALGSCHDLRTISLLADITHIRHGARHLPDASSLLSCGILGGETLDMALPLRGGGGDGGATGAESRDCYLSMYLDRKPDKVNPQEARLARWAQCRLSGLPLSSPCAVDLLGNLFNKEPVVQSLVCKTVPLGLSHLRGLRDIVTIHLTDNPASTKKNNHDCQVSRFHCPITGQEFNGLFKFYALRSCGHVLSARALREVQSSACLVCHASFKEEDKIIINGTDEEVEAMRVRMEEERAKSKPKGSKKERKAEKRAEKDQGGTEQSPGMLNQMQGVSPTPSQTKIMLNAEAHVGSKRTAAVAKVTNSGIDVSCKGGEVLEPSHRPKGSDRVEERKRYKAGAHVPVGATKSVYASLFVSSRKEPMQETFMCRNLPLGRN